jgi:hypothetical protein
MATSKNSIEIITVWDGSWVEELNKTITPFLKDIYFDHYIEEFTIEGNVYYGQDLVKVVIDASSKDHFLEVLKGGQLNQGLLIARLEGWIVRDFGFQLFRVNKQEKSS